MANFAKPPCDEAAILARASPDVTCSLRPVGAGRHDTRFKHGFHRWNSRERRASGPPICSGGDRFRSSMDRRKLCAFFGGPPLTGRLARRSVWTTQDVRRRRDVVRHRVCVLRVRGQCSPAHPGPGSPRCRRRASSAGKSRPDKRFLPVRTPRTLSELGPASPRLRQPWVPFLADG